MNARKPATNWRDPVTGEGMEFHEIVAALLVEEHGRTREDAEALVKAYPQVVMDGMMGGMNYRATAIALTRLSRPEEQPKGE